MDLSAFIYIACGAGLLWRNTAAMAARVLFVYFLFWFLVVRVLALFHSLGVDVYWAACRDAVMVAAAWVMYTGLADDWDRRYVGFLIRNHGVRIARGLYGAALVPFGLAHFQFVPRTAGLIPPWLPAHMALTYFTGVCFVAAGVAILVGVCARLAAALSALEIGLFLVLVWIPALASRSLNAFEWGEAVTTIVLTAAAWVVADSYASTEWLAVVRGPARSVNLDATRPLVGRAR